MDGSRLVESPMSDQLVELRKVGKPYRCCSEAYSQNPGGGILGFEPGLAGRPALLVSRHLSGIGGTSGLDEDRMVPLG